MHGYIYLRKEFVACTTGKDILNLRQVVNFTLDTLVECPEVGNPTNTAVLFRDEKGGREPRRGSTA